MTYVSISSAIRDVLIDDAGVSALVEDRIYPQVLPQKPTFPAITLQQLDSPPIDDITGHAGLHRSIFQIDAWAQSQASSNLLAEKIRLALSGYTGEPLGVKVRGIRLESKVDLFEPEIANYRKIQRFVIWHREENPA